MSNLVGLDGQALGEFAKQDCMVGTELLGAMVSCKIEKDDVVYKLTLEFGSSEYQLRIPLHEMTEEVKRNAWSELLVKAFSAFELGKQFTGMKDIKVSTE